jgi:hypothetical protein
VAGRGRALRAAIEALPEDAWQVEARDRDAVRSWAEVPYVPDGGDLHKHAPVLHRDLALRLLKRQGSLFARGSDRKHFCIVTNREGDGNVMLDNVLSLLKRIGLPAELQSARPKRLRFLIFSTIGRVIRHGRETLLRLSCALRRRLVEAIPLALPPPRA